MKDIRKDIASKYTDAITEDKKNSGVVAQTGAAKFAGYSVDELKHIPADAVESAFGCGNPVAFSALQTGQTVLDLGCGAGIDLLMAAEKVGAEGKVIGIDMTDAMLEKAKKNIHASGMTNIEVRKGYLESLPVASDSIDWVISNCVINLSPNKTQVFAEIARVLKPGGRMIVSDMVAENLPWWVRRSGLLTVACAGGAVPESQYIKGLEAAGLDECDVLARQYFEPVQMASVVVDAMPQFLQTASCCGKQISRGLLTRVVKPIARNLWSARITAHKPVAH